MEKMDKKEKIEKLEELLDVEGGTLEETTDLSKIEEWDSIAHLSLIIMLEEDFGRQVTGKEVRGVKTVRDILALME